ncbi:MAG: hypothetical protein RLZZ628_4324 [Bacteroidota bacterium]|jgi:uncharacterized membrane protein
MVIEKQFTILAFLFGIFAVVLIPPFQSPDEYNHWYRAYQLTEGVWKGVRTADARLGGVIPIRMQQCVAKFQPLKFDYARKTGFDTIQQYLKLPLEKEKTAFVDFTNTAMYAPTAYIPQVATLFVLKKLNVPPLYMMYIGRLVMLLYWIGMMYIALIIMPFRKKSLAILALLPASIFIHSTWNADIVTNGLCFVLMAWIFKIAVEKKDLSVGQQILLGAMVVWIALNKIVYTPFVLLLLINPKTTQKIRLVVLTLIASIAVILWWQMQTQPLYIPYENYHPQYVDNQELLRCVDPKAQMQFVLMHPFHFIKIILPSYIADAGGMMSNYVGKFGWEANFLPRPLLICLFLMVLIQIMKDFTPMSLRTRLYMGAIGALMCVLFAGLMYALWCPVGGNRIWNFQGRYFIAIFPMFFFALPYWKDFKRWLNPIFFSSNSYYGILIFAYFYSIFQILQRYYF